MFTKKRVDSRIHLQSRSRGIHSQNCPSLPPIRWRWACILSRWFSAGQLTEAKRYRSLCAHRKIIFYVHFRVLATEALILSSYDVVQIGGQLYFAISIFSIKLAHRELGLPESLYQFRGELWSSMTGHQVTGH